MVKRENERKQSVRVCLSSWCLSWLTFVEDNTTKHVTLCQCKLKQWLEEYTRNTQERWQVVDRARAVQERHHHTQAVVDGRHGLPNMRGTDANANASTPTKRA